MSGETVTVAGLSWAPLLPPTALAALAVAALGLAAWGMARRGRGAAWRLLALGALLLVLANPQVVQETRTPLPDVALLVIDDSTSQGLGDRPEQTAEAVAALRRALADRPGLEVREVRASDASSDETRGTRLFTALDRAAVDLPPDRLAGAIVVTDGQVHDPPGVPARILGAPVHALISGHRDDTDRRVTVESAPSFGLVGDTVSLALTATDTAQAEGTAIPVTVTVGDGEPRTMTVPNGRTRTVSVAIDHGGPNVVEITAADRPGELTRRNNRTALTINGVRDRLRVLLISGRPHVGERAWRRLLKADPNVDLVHFTILRPPTKDDGTPLSELALISFPIRELFEDRLKDFDLVIFDRYSRHGLVPFGFLENIADYVHAGGALLQAAGPEYAGAYSLFDSPLGDILPATPTGRVLKTPYRPRLDPLGRRHPVTAGLAGAPEGGTASEPSWGPWLRQVEGTQRGGDLLMRGAGDSPLLVLDRVGEGRVALLLSDTLWLWARGYQGGGPQQELVRRLAHWLMKEPELEEEALTARVQDGRLEIERRTLAEITEATAPVVTITAPDGARREVRLAPAGPGRARAETAAPEAGVWRVRHGDLSAVAAAGTADPLEMKDVIANPSVMTVVAEATGGAVRWLEDGLPRIERVKAGSATHGAGWLGLRDNDAYAVDGVRQAALLPPFAALILAIGGLFAAWWREGR